MKQTIEAKEQELQRIFGNDYLFEIPTYQRPYAWTVEQTAELFADLTTAMGVEASIDDVSPYFLGSIVLIKDSKSPAAQVVDGQQRLTTLTILFSVLRELSIDANAKNHLDLYIREQGNPFAGNEDRFRLSLRARDLDFFRDNIQTAGRLEGLLKKDPAPLTDSQQRIQENAAYLWAELKSFPAARRDWLTKFLVQRCYLVVVSASDQQSAYRIFSVMNDRGLDLSPTDILKADIIGALPEQLRAEYTDQWEEIEEELGREDFRYLFTHIRMIYMKSKSQGTLNLEFRDGVLSRINDSKFFMDEVLTPLAEAYQIVSRAAYESSTGAEQVNIYLSHLGRLDNNDWVPAAILYFDRHRDDQSALVAFLRDLERLAYALFLVRANINTRIYSYAALLRSIEAGDDLQADGSPLQLSPREKMHVIAALDGPIYQQTRVRMPLLQRLDSLLADQGATYDHKVMSIEHVLPQTPAEGSSWLGWFPDPEQREHWTHKLANLVLLSRQKNTQAQNYEFSRKKTEYFQKRGVATFAITSQVLGKEEWTPAVLEARQQYLLDRLATEWRLN